MTTNGTTCEHHDPDLKPVVNGSFASGEGITLDVGECRREGCGQLLAWMVLHRSGKDYILDAAVPLYLVAEDGGDAEPAPATAEKQAQPEVT